jgi:hypothetical protein
MLDLFSFPKLFYNGSTVFGPMAFSADITITDVFLFQNLMRELHILQKVILVQ